MNKSVIITKINLDKNINNIMSEINEFEETERQNENVEKSINLI